jgi:hypothetical protein
VSGALADNAPVAPPPTEPPAAAEQHEDQATQAMPAVDADAAPGTETPDPEPPTGNGSGGGSAAITTGDPLAPRERRQAGSE